VLGVWVLCTAALRGDLSRDPRDMHEEHYHDLNAEEEGMRESRAQLSNVMFPSPQPQHIFLVKAE
jgi:hypothetical protein